MTNVVATANKASNKIITTNTKWIDNEFLIQHTQTSFFKLYN